LFICAKDLFVGAKHGWLRHREPVFGGRGGARSAQGTRKTINPNKGRSKGGIIHNRDL